MKPERLWRKEFVEPVSFKYRVKSEGVIDGESEDRDCDEVFITR